MDLGKTALGNWKAQQGGCTHIQVRTSIRRYSTRVLVRVSQRGRIPPFPSCSSSTRSMTSSEFFSSSYVACQWGPELFADTSVSLLPRHPTTTTTPNLWIFCFRFQTKTKIIKLPKPERCTNCGMEFSKHYLRQNLLMEVRGVPA